MDARPTRRGSERERERERPTLRESLRVCALSSRDHVSSRNSRSLRRRRFTRDGDRYCFERFYVTNSIPTTTDNLPKDDCFTVIDITNQIIEDLDMC